MSEPEYQDSRKMPKDQPFHLDPNYYTNQLEKELAEASQQLRMQRAGFEQLQDQYNLRIDTMISLEGELEKTRGEMREHEKFAVDQQLIIQDFHEFKKLLEESGTNYEDLLADLKRVHPRRSTEHEVFEGVVDEPKE